eukprot:TRINITY_DN8186_c0_g1_i1.p1 TRINITY_DN8186_c0_g1~~TRINITY_DN8186_c0_g1_i1.p1  ORF type:complete len:121 (-),score=6.49 TRINITY_DN8186_c0_g1_i1:291-653(-)
MTDTDPAPPLTIVELPLELIGAIADQLPTYEDRGLLMRTCLRLHHGVIVSKNWRIVKEVVSSSERPELILHNRARCLAHAADAWITSASSLPSSHLHRGSLQLSAAGVCCRPPQDGSAAY